MHAISCFGRFLSTAIHTTCGFSFAIAAKGCFESEQNTARQFNSVYGCRPPVARKTMHSDAHFSTVSPLTRMGSRLYSSRELILQRGGHGVCNSVARQESWNSFASASIQGQPLPRAIGERRPVHSTGRLPRDSFLPRKWLFASDEQ